MTDADDGHPAALPQSRGAYGLSGSEGDCPWCRELLLPGSDRPGPEAEPPPPDGTDSSCRRCPTARRLGRARAVMVLLAAIVTVVAAVMTATRT